MAVLCKFHVYDRQFAKRTSARGTHPQPLPHHSWLGKNSRVWFDKGKGTKPQAARLLATSCKCRERQHRRILMTFLSGVFSALPAYTLVQGITIVL